MVAAAIAQRQTAIGKGKGVQVLGERARRERVAVRERHHTRHRGRVVATLERAGELGRGGLALSDRHCLDGRSGEEQVARDQRGVVAAREEGCARQRLPHGPGGVQRRVHVRGESAGDADRARPERAQVVEQRRQRVQPQIGEPDVVPLRFHRSADALQPQRLDPQHLGEPERRSLWRLDQRDAHLAPGTGVPGDGSRQL